MKVAAIAQASARVAVVLALAEAELGKAMSRWFIAQILNRLKIDVLRDIYRAGAYEEFQQLLERASDPDLIKALGKVDKYRPELRTRPKRDILKHIEDLAIGRMSPAERPRPAKPPRQAPAKKLKAAPKPRAGVLASSKY